MLLSVLFSPAMELAHHRHLFIHRRTSFTLFSSSKTLSKPTLCFSNTSDSPSPKLALTQSLQSETLKILEWSSLCRQLSPFTTTSMGLRATENAQIPMGETLQESRKLLQQTSAAVSAAALGPWDFSGIEDVSPIIDSAANGEVLTVRAICTVLRMLVAAGKILEKLETASDSCVNSPDWYSFLLSIFRGCDYQMELAKKIQFCIDCNLSVILNRASEGLEIIRYERKRNMEELDSMLKQVSFQIFRSGGFDKPLVTKRRSRMCVGVRASHKHLLPGGIVLDVSSSGATYFMEPKDAVNLNNMEVRLSSSEKAEEIAILSLLTSEIADSGTSIRDLLSRFQEIDLAFARAAYARHLDGVCPILSSVTSEGLDFNGDDASFTVDIQSLQHPLLLASLQSSNVSTPNSVNGKLEHRSSPTDTHNGPIPIDIKIQSGTRVVVISGPNTGGKTASMKTLGLASLMSKAGLYLPAKSIPRLPWFNLVLADIGDHQSLEQNLSTFSGHISRIRDILQVASKESLVLLDEIGSGTDPSEGVALSTSILQYLKNCVYLAMVTTHYADLTLLKEKDKRFENAAMEFSIETLKPTYRILWGSSGDSNALSIAKSIGFDENIIERAKKWVEKLKPERQQERKGLVYQSLLEERNRLEAQADEAACIHVKIMDIYSEILAEAEDLGSREKALMAIETRRVRQELKVVQTKIDSVVREFENQLRTVRPDQFSTLIRKSESTLASIVEAYQPAEPFNESKTGDDSEPSYTPESGEQVYVKGLGNKLATVAEAAGNDGDNTVLVQYGKVRVRVNKTDIRAVAKNIKKGATVRTLPQSKRKGRRSMDYEEPNQNEEISYGPLIQTSKNSVDLRGMRVEEAAFQLDIAISSRGPNSVLFIVHGMGTGAVKERAMEILKSHPRVVKYEQESPQNYGCTVAFIR